MSELTFATENCKEFITIDKIDGQLATPFFIYPTNTPDSCGDKNSKSNYSVFFFPLEWTGDPWESQGSFEVILMNPIDQTVPATKLDATCNFPPSPNEKSDLYLTRIFPKKSTGNINIRSSESNEKRFIGNVLLKGDMVLNSLTYSIELTFDYFIEPTISNLYSVGNIKLVVNPQANDDLEETQSPSSNPTLLKSINKKLKDNNINVFIEFQTDKIGLNLGEMYCRIYSDKEYPNSYPKRYIGTCVDYQIPTNSKIISTFYSFKPKLKKVLKLDGNVLYQQTKNINKKYKSGLNDCQFYFNILAYSTLRYIFAGLSNNSKFSIKWLYSNNYELFLYNLQNSEFSAAVPLFTKPQPEFDFSNYNRYYRECKCKK